MGEYFVPALFGFDEDALYLRVPAFNTLIHFGNGYFYIFRSQHGNIITRCQTG